MARLKLKIRKKNLKYYLQSIFTRKLIVAALLVVQFGLFALLYVYTAKGFAAAYFSQTLLAGIIVLFIVNSDDHPSYKIAWLVPLVILPGFMSIVYIFVHTQLNRFFFSKRVNETANYHRRYLVQDKDDLAELYFDSTEIGQLASYLSGCAGYPVYRHSDIRYFEVGDKMYPELLEALKNAKRYILMEYFIIDSGKMCESIIKILLQKAQSGVEVKLMYDGMGSGSILPWGFDDFLNDNGVQCKVFNRFIPFLASKQNNRDHRKITVVDGEVAFTGGINLADEYINQKQRFGHWKDSGVKVTGEAVRSFTVMFFQMWDINENTYTDANDYDAYKPTANMGYIIPYGDAPNDTETVGKTVYLDLINKAKKSIYITAPYFVIDNELVTALSFAAKSGLDVKVLVPGIYDKWYVHQMSMCYYRDLIPQGVRFFSYTPGFVHQKNFIIDGETAVVGTINTDFRSLYLHFEDAVLFYKNPTVKDVENDFLNALSSSSELTLQEVNKNIFSRLLGSLIKAFGPLL